MCSYIYVKYDTDKLLFKAPTMTGHNFDPTKGRMYVSYEITLTPEQLGGKFISQVGFASDQSALLVVNSSNVAITKQEGSPLLISGTLYLDMSGSNHALLRGDNRLVRMLLGTEMFMSSGFRMASSTRLVPSNVYEFDEPISSTMISVPIFSEDSITFAAKFHGEYTDVALLYDGVPVLRGLPTLEEAVLARVATSNQDDYTRVMGGDGAIRVENVVINYTPVSDYYVRREVDGLIKVEDCTLKLPNNAKIKQDHTCNYFAYQEDGRAAIFTLKDGQLNVQKWVKTADIIPCEDGSYFLIAHDKSITYVKDKIEKKLGFKAGEKSAVAFKDDSYVFLTYIGGELYLYKINSEFNETLEKYPSMESAEDVHIFSLEGTVCAVNRLENTYAFTPEGEYTLRKNWLSAICDPTWFTSDITPVYDYGRLLLYNNYYGYTNYYVGMSTRLIAGEGYGRLYGEFCIQNTPFSANISTIDKQLDVLDTVDEKVTHAITKDAYLYLFLASGKIRVYYIKSEHLRIYSNKILNGSIINFDMVRLKPLDSIIRLVLNRKKP